MGGYRVFTVHGTVENACNFYRIVQPLNMMKRLGFPVDLLVDDGTFQLDQNTRNAMLLESDISFLYQNVAAMTPQLMKGSKTFKPMKEPNGEVQWPPTFISDTDDDLFNVSPLNVNFDSLGTKHPNGTELKDGEEIGISHPLEVAPAGIQVVLNQTHPRALPGEQAKLGEQRYIFDVDAMWHPFLSLWKDGQNIDLAQNRKRLNNWRETLKCSNLITCSTLGAEAAIKREIGDDAPTYVAYNSINFAEYPKVELAEHPNEVRILWEGSSTHHEGLWPLNKSFVRVAEKYPHAKFIFWGAPYKWAGKNLPANQVEFREWIGFAGYKPMASTIGHDISIAPLHPCTFNDSRSGIRFYENSALWKPAATLAQNTAAYAAEIIEGETGMLFNTPEEFEEKLGALIENETLRKTLASNAKDWVRTNRDVVKITTALFHKWIEVREGHKQTMPAPVDFASATIEIPLPDTHPVPIEDVNFSIIIPTCGRPEISRMLTSLTSQLGPNDEVLVVGDGPQPVSGAAVKALGDKRVRYIEGPLTQRLGNAQRDLGRAEAKNPYLWFVDDDDEILPDSLQHMRADIAADGKRPHYFIMLLNGIPFDSRRFVQGGMGTPQIVWPNHPDFPSWDAGEYGLDMETITTAMKLWPEGPVWHDRVVYRYIDPKGTVLKRKPDNALATT